MGIYDTYVNKDKTVIVQLKVGDFDMSCYCEGDKAIISDGIYHDYGGVVVVYNGMVVHVLADWKELRGYETAGLKHYTKWGDDFDPSRMTLSDLNPISQAIAGMDKPS